MAFRICLLRTRLYEHQPSFIKDMTKTFWLAFFLGHGVVSTMVRSSEEIYRT